jgi:hypothetical protein
MFDTLEGMLTPAVHELIEWEVAAAYAHGYSAALREIAEAYAELDSAWRPVGRHALEQRVAARLAEMERCARALRAELDRHGTGDWPPVAATGSRTPPPAAQRSARC